eukprot:scaffold3079_cov107-Isochrysis_galbana.AAC.3
MKLLSGSMARAPSKGETQGCQGPAHPGALNETHQWVNDAAIYIGPLAHLRARPALRFRPQLPQIANVVREARPEVADKRDRAGAHQLIDRTEAHVQCQRMRRIRCGGTAVPPRASTADDRLGGCAAAAIPSAVV